MKPILPPPSFQSLIPCGRLRFVAIVLLMAAASVFPLCAQQNFDYGDAPDPAYPTLMASGGAQHVIVPGGLFLGALIDPEQDGQPTPGAIGDDLAMLRDDDGISFPVLPAPGAASQVQVQVVASGVGFLNAWLDFAADGSWAQPGDQIFTNAALVAGTNLLSFTVPQSAVLGVATYARFRLSSTQNLGYMGAAPDGEVEDYQVVILGPQSLVDFGDAPDPSYPTLLASMGAFHLIVPNMFMGSQIDGETDGQPSAVARGDDNANLADEDGVVFVTRLVQGQLATVVVRVTQPGFINAWIDFQRDGTWVQPIDQIFINQPVTPGANTLIFGVPFNAAMGPTFARFRYNSTGNLTYTGPAADGEVEDYLVRIEDELVPTDFGDAPDPSYPTLFANNGAFHYIASSLLVPIQLGSMIDSETNGLPNATATGDDNMGLADEDGVIFGTLTAGQTAAISVIASTNGNLSAWIDFGADGTWAQAGDTIFSGFPLVPGTNTLTFPVPSTAAVGFTLSRFRFTMAGALTYTGMAPDGEVEDYQVKILAPQQSIDFGDAPDGPYPTLLASNGARHIVTPGLLLGALVDGETNGQPNFTANGDDLANLADEDGVTFLPPLINPGQVSQVRVTVLGSGFLNAWVDFAADGSWAQAGDQIFTNLPLATGTYTLNYFVSSNALWGANTVARFRFSSMQNLSFTGPAPDGEVEDHMVNIHALPGTDLGDAPDSSNNTGATMTAYPTGTNAAFPTVYSTLAPYGPIHFNPVTGVAFLGSGLSGEVQADGGADQDFINNLIPALNLPDLDGADDGLVTNPPVILPHCGQGVIMIQAFVSPAPVMFLNIWCDWNRDGDWNDIMVCPDGTTAPEWACTNFPVPPPGGLLAIPVQSWHRSTQIEPIWIRVSLAEQNWPPPGGGVAGGDGPANGYQLGETEDYYLTNYLLQDTYDFGDAPDPAYPTLLASTGARHLLVKGFLLGSQQDAEPDGLPNPAATGDDSAGMADEDGVMFTTPLVLGTQAWVNVMLQSGAAGGFLDAWLDFNRDGVWGAGDQIFSSQPLAVGLNTNLSFAVPSNAALGPSYARFRLSSSGGLTPSGLAMDGEVEDYLITLRQPRPSTNIVITNISVSSVTVGTNAGLAVQVRWNSETNIHYQLQGVTNLVGASTNWMNIGPEVIGPANTQSETNAPPPAQRYYRVLAPFTWP